MHDFNSIPLTENYVPVRGRPGFGPATEVLFLRENDPKPLTPPPASFNEMDARHRRASQLAALKQGSPAH